MRYKIGNRVEIKALPELGAGEVYYIEDHPDKGFGPCQVLGLEFPDGATTRVLGDQVKKARPPKAAPVS